MIAQLNYIAQIWWQWMAGMFWQVSLFIILITVLDMAIRRWAWPQVRYVLWGLVFLKLIIPPTWQMPTSIVSWIQPKVEQQMPFRIDPRNIITVNPHASALSMVSTQQVTKSVVTAEKLSWQAVALITWLAGMITFGLMLIIKISRLPKGSNKQDEQNAPEWFNELLAKTAQRLKLKKIPTFVFSKDTVSPAVYGLFSPVLLLPEGCLDKLSQEQAEHVLIHELCHLKRGDLLVHWLCLILQVIYWFNPLLIWTRRQMRHLCEICCDLSVASILKEKTIDYRNTLVATARELLTENVEPGLGLLGVFEEPFRLVTRLRWLEKKTWENRRRKIAANIVTCLIMVLCVMPMAGMSQQVASNQPEYKNGIEFEQDNGLVAMTFPAVFYKAIFVESTHSITANEDVYHQSPTVTEMDSPIDSNWPTINLFRIFKNDIKIDGESYPDVESAINSLGYNGALIRNILIPANKIGTTKISLPANGGDCYLKIAPWILTKNGLIRQEISLNVHGHEIFDVGDVGGPEFENGATLVISFPSTGKIGDEKWVYFFLTPHVIKTMTDAKDYLQKSNNKLATDVVYSDLISDNYETRAIKAPEYKLGVEFDNWSISGDFNKFVAAFSERTGNKYVVDEKIIQKFNGQKFTIRLPQQISADECKNYFQKFLDDCGYVAVPSGDVIKIMEK